MHNSRGYATPDPGLLVALLIGALAAWPLLTRASLPTLTDAHHHIYRTYEIIASWREGIPYLRWAPDFFYGYGYPVFNYYAPLTYYLAAAYGWFTDPVAGVKFVLVVSALGSALGMYVLVRDLWGPTAGLVSAAAYSLSPYLVFINPLLRGAMPEFFALALAPALLWLFYGLARRPTRLRFAVATFSSAALVLSHNLLSLVLLALALAWAAWQLPALEHAQRRRAVAVTGAAIIAGLGLAAFFWLPALLERDAIQLQGAFLPGEARGLVAPAELFGPAAAADARALQIADFKFRLGLPQWLLGLAGALTLLWRQRTHPGATLFFALVGAISIGLMLPASAPLWHSFPPLAYLQFAWRLLGVAALCLAVLAGAATQWGQAFRPLHTARVLPAALLAALCVAALPLLNPLPWPEFGPVNPQTILELELSGRWGVGTTHGIEFMPRAVHWRPVPQPAVIAAIQAGAVEKIDRAALPAETQVTLTGHGALLRRLRQPVTRWLRAAPLYPRLSRLDGVC